LPAKNVWTTRSSSQYALSLTTIASKLAPTGTRKAPFISMNGAFVRKKECFSTTHGIMRAVMTISNEQGE